jgi:beta-phosphoglucomutase-like phosphatase (HAD superfamily)
VISWWATVLLALITASAGVVGGVAVTEKRIRFDRDENAKNREHEKEQQRQQLEHERSEQWVDRLIRAADDFSTGVEPAILGVRDVISVVSGKGDVAAAAVEAKRRNHEAVARVARIKLLFGENSDAANVARDLLPELEVARSAAERPDPTFAWEKLEKVYALYVNVTAREMISSRQPGGTTL